LGGLTLLLTGLLIECRAPSNARQGSRAPAADNVIRQDGYQVELIDETGDQQHAAQLRAWLVRALHAVSETTGGAPELLRVVARQGSGRASTRGRVITMQLRDGPRPADSSREWVLHHELIHASFPSLPEQDLWLEEGLATYLEPLVRVRAGQLQASVMWRELADDLPQGAPRAGEGGLAGTEVWHRLYWQGAVFWLNAELIIDRRTHGQRNLHDALCSWARAGGSGDDWNAERAFMIMDHALGQPILLELYRKASAHGIDQQPTQLLAELGVRVDGPEQSVRFAVDAPAAGLRERMTTAAPRPCVR
jgi:hypothetical protein